MAEYCRQCSIRMSGEDFHELAGQTSQEDWKQGKMAVVICEGCGPIQVDPEGNCVSTDCLVNHEDGVFRQHFPQKRLLEGEK